MFYKVEVRSDQGELLTLSLQDIANGYVIEDIEGLDPVKATLIYSGFAGIDGSQYQSSRRDNRNLIFKLKYEPDFATGSVGELRSNLYRFFMPKSQVSLRFFRLGYPTVDIVARVEDFNSPLFAKEPKATISMLCFDPDFVEPSPVILEGFTTDTSTEATFEYDGNIETGIKFRLLVDRTISEFAMYHRPADNSLRTLEFAAPLVAGDVLEISTVTGSKGATLTHVGVGSSILFGISPQSYWIQFFKGQNKLRVFAEGAAIPFTIEYVNRYGGL